MPTVPTPSSGEKSIHRLLLATAAWRIHDLGEEIPAREKAFLTAIFEADEQSAETLLRRVAAHRVDDLSETIPANVAAELSAIFKQEEKAYKENKEREAKERAAAAVVAYPPAKPLGAYRWWARAVAAVLVVAFGGLALYARNMRRERDLANTWTLININAENKSRVDRTSAAYEGSKDIKEMLEAAIKRDFPQLATTE